MCLCLIRRRPSIHVPVPACGKDAVLLSVDDRRRRVGVVSIPAGMQRSMHGVQQNFAIQRVSARGCLTSRDIRADVKICLDTRMRIALIMGWETHDISGASDLHKSLMRSVHRDVADK